MYKIDDYFQGRGTLSVGLSSVYKETSQNFANQEMAFRIATMNAEIQRKQGDSILCSVSFPKAIRTENGQIQSVNVASALIKRLGAQNGDVVDLLMRVPDLYDPDMRGVFATKPMPAKTPSSPAWIFANDVLAPNCD